MASPFSHLEMGMVKISFSVWLNYGGRQWDNKCESFGKFKSFEQMGAIGAAMCVEPEAAVGTESFQKPCQDL